MTTISTPQRNLLAEVQLIITLAERLGPPTELRPKLQEIKATVGRLVATLDVYDEEFDRLLKELNMATEMMKK